MSSRVTEGPYKTLAGLIQSTVILPYFGFDRYYEGCQTSATIKLAMPIFGFVLLLVSSATADGGGLFVMGIGILALHFIWVLVDSIRVLINGLTESTQPVFCASSHSWSDPLDRKFAFWVSMLALFNFVLYPILSLPMALNQTQTPTAIAKA
jgi:hypothetical protein